MTKIADLLKVTLSDSDVRPHIVKMFKKYNLEHLLTSKPIVMKKIGSDFVEMVGYDITVPLVSRLRRADHEKVLLMAENLQVNENHSKLRGCERHIFIPSVKLKGMWFLFGDGDDSLAAEFKNGKFRFWLRSWPSDRNLNRSGI